MATINTMPERPEVQDEPLGIITLTTASCCLSRIICFDAGGAGCLSSLAILRRIMYPSGSHNPAAHPEPERSYPCRHFELFYGSEWGAVLAIMLGRLRMV